MTLRSMLLGASASSSSFLGFGRGTAKPPAATTTTPAPVVAPVVAPVLAPTAKKAEDGDADGAIEDQHPGNAKPLTAPKGDNDGDDDCDCDPEEDEDCDCDDDEATKAVSTRGRLFERGRIAAILGAPEAAGRIDLAAHLALNTGHGAKAVRLILAAAPMSATKGGLDALMSANPIPIVAPDAPPTGTGADPTAKDLAKRILAAGR